MKVFFTFVFVLLISSHLVLSQTLRVAIASSLVPAMKELKVAFEKESEIRIELIPGASGTLTHQMMNGAPFDILISANEIYSNKLYDEGICSFPKKWISGQLVLWTTRPVSTDTVSLRSILNQVKVIAIAQPEIAPYGAAAMAFLDEYSVDTSDRLIYGNSISITNQYIYTASADAVFTSVSSQNVLQPQSDGYWTRLDWNSKLLTHSIVINKQGATSLAGQFTDYLLSSKATAIIQSYGYFSSSADDE